eukprot:473853-Amphidinium_carterae.1
MLFPPLPITPRPPDMPNVDAMASTESPCRTVVGKRFRPVGLQPDIDFQRETYILRWAELIGSDLEASELGRRSMGATSVSDSIYQAVQNILSTKADGTIHKRLLSLQRYCKWSQQQGINHPLRADQQK